jgi:ADP-ribose pyrophosphatase
MSMPPEPVPRIVSREEQIVSPWVRMVERTVDFRDGRIESYHAIAQADYVGILAVTPEGLIPIVRQYRPALERFTWELPAGMVDEGESPESTCARELREETGLIAKRIHKLGVFAADSARLSNHVHCFLVETEPADHSIRSEPGIEVRYMDFGQLRSLILAGGFDLQYHVGVIGLALLRPETAALLGKA